MHTAAEVEHATRFTATQVARHAARLRDWIPKSKDTRHVACVVAAEPSALSADGATAHALRIADLVMRYEGEEISVFQGTWEAEDGTTMSSRKQELRRSWHVVEQGCGTRGEM